MERPHTTTRRVNLYDLAPGDVASALAPFVAPSFRIRQVQEWIYARGVDSFESMSNLSREARADLAARFSLAFPVARERTEPAHDGSVKYLFTLEDGALIEAVYMPMGSRTTLCLSSQAGCAVGCTFCVTGFFGAGRNLTPAEIVGQIHRVRHEQGVANEALNVVFMGMGEPMLNFEHVATSLEIMEQSISLKRVTVSTAGIIPGIEELAKLERRPNLAVSINAPDRERREEIMPITKKYPLEELIASLRRFPLETGRDITAEYVLLAGWNDSVADAATLAKLLRGGRFKVNAIPFNPDPALPSWMKRPTDAAIDRFASALMRHGVPVTVRRSKGNEIAAACGQLRGRTERRRAAPKG
ncbi:MAG: 23S rRNA (adenine(2503)-C(2))-methyltransferase RlmN [Acidobacteria bacterium]|nr:23S rRNA (adenine(2503)-C(2))-methyltransferase RlmN [Acidobacteriota bacterium]